MAVECSSSRRSSSGTSAIEKDWHWEPRERRTADKKQKALIPQPPVPPAMSTYTPDPTDEVDPADVPREADEKEEAEPAAEDEEAEEDHGGDPTFASTRPATNVTTAPRPAPRVVNRAEAARQCMR